MKGEEGVIRPPELGRIGMVKKKTKCPICGGEMDERKDELDAYVMAHGRLRQGAVGYVPFSPPPVFWDYKCRKCLKFQPPASCAWVDGKVAPEGWCAVWIPSADYKPFTWPAELLAGNW